MSSEIINYNQFLEDYTKNRNPNIRTIRHYKTIDYYDFVPMGFDIETSTIYKKNNKGDVIYHYSFMYCWQFGIDSNVYIGRTWEDFDNFIKALENTFCYCGRKLLVFIHNQSFELSFMGNELLNRGHTVDVFARKKRKPMRIDIDNCITFIDSYLLTHYSLEKLAENYCKTKKLVGELDYSKIRHFSTPLKEKGEKEYCMNDVIILCEYAEYYDKLYFQYGNMPFTLTMIASKYMKDYVKQLKCGGYVFNLMKNCYPQTKEMYEYIMKFYTGAYTHGMLRNLFQTLYNGIAFDVTSEYPYVLMSQYYPMSPFKELKCYDFEVVNHYLKNMCCLIECDLIDIETTTGVTILSKNKVENVKGGVWDNGRLYKAKSLHCYITEVDLKTLRLHYNFSIKYTKIMYAKRGYLPKYFRLTIAYLYSKKCILKGVEEKKTEYNVAKEELNGQYGALVMRIIFENILYNGKWDTEKKDVDFSTIWKSKNKLPQWGIYCTSHSRYLILSTVHKIKPDDYWYSDTDSIKCKNKKYILEMFEKTNAEIRKNNEKWINDLQLNTLFPKVDFAEMGTFSREEDLKRFKCLGSKRYITETEKGIETTVAGLPKKAFLQYCKKYKLEPFEAFEDNIIFNSDESQKLCTYYCDDTVKIKVTDYLGNAENITINGYVSLIPTTFKLNVTDSLWKLFHSETDY